MGITFLLIYVDDISMPRKDEFIITSLKQIYRSSFHMKELRHVTYFLDLDLEVISICGSLPLNVDTQKIIKMAWISNVNQVNTPNGAKCQIHKK